MNATRILLPTLVLAAAPGLVAAQGKAAAPTASDKATAPVQDKAEIDRTQIIGNRELPKVLYIVPWKKPLPGEMSGRPVASVLDEALAPVDRDVFRRQVQYDAQLNTPSPKSAAPATPAR